jgi:hypothetical protein
MDSNLIFGEIFEISKILTSYRRAKYYDRPANHIESFSFPSAK